MGEYSEWSSCIYTTRDPPRRDEPLKIPESVEKSTVSDVIEKPVLLFLRKMSKVENQFALIVNYYYLVV